MIEESFIQSSIRIRRQYLKLTNNMDLYKRKATDVVSNLEDILAKVEIIKLESENGGNSDSILKELKNILSDIEDEGRRLEENIEPLNVEIEKLSLEEGELWRNIKQKHYDLNDDDIIEYVKSRLVQENLS
jgi:hypothetical protein